MENRWQGVCVRSMPGRHVAVVGEAAVGPGVIPT